MFGKLTITKIEKFLMSSSNVSLFIVTGRSPIDSFNLFDNIWESIIYKKFNVRLTPEQKWYLFLSLCNKMKVDLENELIDINDYIVKLIARNWTYDSGFIKTDSKLPLEVLKNKNIPLLTLAEYIISNPSLQRGDKMSEMQVLVHKWYKAETLRELVDIQKEICAYGI